MTRRKSARLALFACGGLLLAACQDEERAGGAPTTGAPGQEAVAAAPITLDYEMLGRPVVGMPLSINVTVTADLDTPLTLVYRINETTGLRFAEAQSQRVSLLPVDERIAATEQVTVIPQREGRLFLNVSAETETESGKLARVMAIPIQVAVRRP